MRDGLVAVMAFSFSLGGLRGFEGASDSEEVEVADVAPVTGNLSRDEG
jgi:hypothetical protein